jgi:DNA-binding beta-propeller fold protein YncE
VTKPASKRPHQHVPRGCRSASLARVVAQLIMAKALLRDGYEALNGTFIPIRIVSKRGALAVMLGGLHPLTLRVLRSGIIALSAGVIATMPLCSFAQPTGAPIELLQSIRLPGVRGRIDHLDIDLDSGRLFVAALGNDTLEVVDLRADTASGRVNDLREPQGVAYVPAANRLFVSNGVGARVDVFPGDTRSLIGRIDALEDADNVRYDAADGRIYVGYASALAVIDVATLQVLKRIELAGHPESFQLAKSSSRIFINVPSAREIAVVDRRQASVVARWTLGEARGNFPMALDESAHRLFVATRRPAALVVFDTETGKQVSSTPIGGDADDLFIDNDHKMIYAICGEGVVTVVQVQDSDRYVVIGDVRTAPGARTGLYVRTQKTLYVAVPAQQSMPAEIRVYKVR